MFLRAGPSGRQPAIREVGLRHTYFPGFLTLIGITLIVCSFSTIPANGQELQNVFSAKTAGNYHGLRDNSEENS